MKTKNLVNVIALSGILLGCNPKFYDEGFSSLKEKETQQKEIFSFDEFHKTYWVIPIGTEQKDAMGFMMKDHPIWDDRQYLYNNDEVKNWYKKAKTNSAYRDSLDYLIHKYNNFIFEKNDFSFSHSPKDPLTIMVINNELYVDVIFNGEKRSINIGKKNYVEHYKGYDALATYWYDISNRDLRDMVSLNEEVSFEEVVLKMESFTIPDADFQKALEKYERTKKGRRPTGITGRVIDSRRVYVKNKFGEDKAPDWLEGESRLIPVKIILNMMHYRVEE